TYTREIFDGTCISKLVQALDITLATNFDWTLDIYFDKVANLLACPLASFLVRSNRSGDTDDIIAREQATDKGDALNVGVAILTAKAKSFIQICAYDISIQHFDLAAALSKALF